jgi:DNA-directed RNA polymerase subunit beta
MGAFDTQGQYNNLKSSVTDAVKEILKIETDKYKLSVHGVHVDDSVSSSDYRSQKDAKLKQQTWSVPVYANVSITDKETGKVVSKNDKLRVMNLPKVTDRGSYIVGGNEYQVMHQLRLRPGVYMTSTKSGDIKAQVNLAKGGVGKNLGIELDEDKLVLTAKQATIPLYDLLRGLGMSHASLNKHWGSKATDIQAEQYDLTKGAKAVERFQQAFTSGEDATAFMLRRTAIDPETTKAVVGTAYNTLHPELLALTAGKLIKVKDGQEPLIDRDSLFNKSLHGVEDFVKERLVKRQLLVKGKIQRKLDKNPDVNKLVTPGVFSPLVEKFFSDSDKAMNVEQTNPLTMLSDMEKITILGEGGLSADSHQITNEMREVHPTHLGFIDPINTPESGVGATLHMPLLAKKQGDTLKTPVINMKNGKREELTPADMFNSVVAFPDQFKETSGNTFGGGPIASKIKATYKGVMGEYPASKVQYRLVAPQQMFSLSVNMIPFLASDQGNRAMMASKHMTQAIPLKEREAPIVQVRGGPNVSHTFEQAVGSQFSIKAPIDGTVHKIDKDYIHIKSGRSVEKIPLYNNFHLNQNTFMQSDPAVQVGQRVAKGQLLADSNFTKGGELALGTHLRAAFLPYKGYNFEDGIVISESAAKKLTSEHIHKESIHVDDTMVLNPNKFRSEYPSEFPPTAFANLDAQGVITKGSKVKYGDPIFVGLRLAQQSIGQHIHKVLTRRYNPVVEKWAHDDEGTVIDVKRVGSDYTIYIKTEEPAKIGDKLALRHGNKGVITHILADNKAPHNADGQHVEIMLNPQGVIGRMNVGQIYESAVAKAAMKAGKPYVVENFTKDSHLDDVKSFLHKTKVSDKEVLIDPDTNKPLGNVHVGNPYILKLHKQSAKSYSARGYGPGQKYTGEQQPGGSGEEGSKSLDLLTLYSMLAHGSRENLREMSTIKGERNDEYWEALKTGQRLPAPKVPFVFNKFIDYMKAAGVNVEKKGNELALSPMTDEETARISKMTISEPAFVQGKNIKEIKGGLVDPVHLGGLKGTHWGHIQLKEPVVNPIFEKPIKLLTGLKGNTYDDVVMGQKTIDVGGKQLTGGLAVETLLKGIDIDKELATTAAQMNKAKGTALDDLSRKYRYLTVLKEQKIRPETAYINYKIPVLPPIMRPINAMPDGSLAAAQMNYGYLGMGVLSRAQHLPVMKMLSDENKAALRKDLYQYNSALRGMDTVSMLNKEVIGAVGEIAGTQPKTGMFQSKILKKQQDLVGRGVILPEPSLGVDQVGLPKEMLWKLYEPFLTKALVRNGLSLKDARKEVETRSFQAQRALDNEIKLRPVMLNRAPSLHKFSIMGFNPVPTEGKTIKIPSLVTAGFNADFDGDCQLTSILTAVDKSSIHHLCSIYNKHFVEERLMTARYKEVLPVKHEQELLMLHLSEFPYGDLIGIKEGKNGRIDFYRALPGYYVMAMDELTQKVDWQPVYGWSKHYKREIEIVTLRSGRQIITDNDERAVYGIEQGSLEYTRNTPQKAVDSKMLIPRVRSLELEDSSEITSVQVGDIQVPLNRPFGYLLGSLIANGWVEHKHNEPTGRIVISVTDTSVQRNYLDSWKDIFGVTSFSWGVEGPKENSSKYGDSEKITINHKGLSLIGVNLIGKGAHKKHLPPFFLQGSREFRIGLFAGLMDNDGGIGVSKAKAKPQLMANYSSVSLRLVQEVQTLARSLGINGRVTDSNTPKGAEFWMLSFSNLDIKKWGGDGLQSKEKLDKITNTPVMLEGPSAAKDDVVPISSALATAITKALGAPRNASLDQKSLYTVFHKAKTCCRLSRITAKSITSWLTTETCKSLPDWDKWWAIVTNDTVTWDPVESYKCTGIKEDGYDLTVLGYETFMNVDGIVLSNTMTLHVPISDKAVAEAREMMPSKHLYKPGTGALMLIPTNEAMLGIYYLSSTPAGRDSLNKVLPAKYKVLDKLNKKTVKQLFIDMSKNLPEQEFANILNKVKNLGEVAAYTHGSTLGVDDITIPKNRDTLVNHVVADFKAGRDTSASEKHMRDQMMEHLGKNNSAFYHMLTSGASGKDRQVQQITVAPVFVKGYKGSIMPTPITKSYAEGIDTASYWAASYGARSGMIDRAVQTSEPGAFSKEILAATADVVVSAHDCGTHKGIDMSIDSTELYDRHLAGDQHGVKHNTLVTPDVIKTLRSKHTTVLHVRSPLTCQSVKGVCRMCQGLDERGKLPMIGENVGVKAGQAIAEPMTQMTMRTFHTGGLAGTGMKKGGFERIKQLLEMPQFVAGEAPLALASGRITKVTPGIAGLVNIHVHHDGEKKETIYHAPKGAALKHKVGSIVHRGDVLSEGTVKPQSLMQTKGMLPALNYITDELTDAYKDQGINRKTFETLLRPVGNLTKVTKGSIHAPEWGAGEFAPYSVVNAFNSNLKTEIPVNDDAIGYIMDEAVGQKMPVGYIIESMEDINYLKKSGKRTIKVQKQAIKHSPTLRGINTLPLLKKDWLAQMGFNHIRDAVTSGASEGWKSNIHGYHPIPAFAHGAEFGQGEEGKY